jgi:hypothetical protein
MHPVMQVLWLLWLGLTVLVFAVIACVIVGHFL